MRAAWARAWAWLLAALLATLAPLAHADERILSYDSVVEVQADGSLEVTEHLRVRAEGTRIRRGLTRDFPTRYRDRHGNAVVVGFEVVGVERDGRAEPWFTESMSNGVRVNTGDDSLLPVPLEATWTLRYRTTHQLGFFEGHDELYWNAIGHGWPFPIDGGSVEVRLPEPVPVEALAVEGWTGPQGTRGTGFEAALVEPGVARWTLTQPLAPSEGLTIALAFPKDVVAAPTRVEQAGRLLSDNAPILVALAGLLVLVAWCLWRWLATGRDPRPGVVIARYEPPRGESPSALRYLWRRSYDKACTSADLLACAVQGAVVIEHEKGGLLSADQWTLRRGALPSAEVRGEDARRLLQALLPDWQRELRLVDDNAPQVQKAMARHEKALRARFQPEMFKRNAGGIAGAFLILVATGLVTLMAAAAADGGGMPWALVPLGLGLAVAIAYACVAGAPTPEGRRMLDEIEGFRRYLSVAEQEDLAKLEGPAGPAPELDAERFEALLPYAVALDVEEAWTGRFTAAVGTEAAAVATSAAMPWYRGDGRRGSDLAGLTRAVGASLGTTIASASTPPGSTSGSGGFSGGGGGFSGGGGGGGGGGGR